MRTVIARSICFCLSFFVVGLSSPAAAQNQQDKIQQALDLAYRKGEFSGVVMASKNDDVVFSAAVGQANRTWNIANQTNTKFRISSITKQFTAMLVMQLIESGRVMLDAPLTDYLKSFRPETGGKIHIRHLLQNASGLPDMPDAFYVDEDAKMADAEFVVKKYLQGDLNFDPGTKFNYSNADFLVLGEVIRAVTGQSFEVNLQDKILKPLGMAHTGLLKNEAIQPGLASGYDFNIAQYVNEGFVQIQNLWRSGRNVFHGRGHAALGQSLAKPSAVVQNPDR